MGHSAAREYRYGRKCGEFRSGFFTQVDPGLSGSNAKQLFSVPHMMQLSAESASHPCVHQRKFPPWLGGIAKEHADNSFRKGAAASTLAHTTFPLSNPHRRIILSAGWAVEFARLRIDA